MKHNATRLFRLLLALILTAGLLLAHIPAAYAAEDSDDGPSQEEPGADPCEVSVTWPVSGQHPVSVGESADPDRFTVVTVTFAPVEANGSLGAALVEADVFAPMQIYRITVLLKPTGDWSFSEDIPVTVNGLDASYATTLNGFGIYHLDMQTENPFVDVQESDFFFKPVMWAVGKTVTCGIDESHFAPDTTVMRADAMVFFWAAKGRPAHSDVKSPFVDVKPKRWYYDAVMWAVERRVCGGTDRTHFSPQQTCSRSEILQFLYAAMNKPAYTIENPYSDVKNGQWYKDGAIWAYEKGLEKGENGKFNAKTPCTRGYVVTYLYRFLTGQELAE